MTLEQAKQKVAKDCGKETWKQLVSGVHHYMLEGYWEKVAVIYAQNRWTTLSGREEHVKEQIANKLPEMMDVLIQIQSWYYSDDLNDHLPIGKVEELINEVTKLEISVESNVLKDRINTINLVKVTPDFIERDPYDRFIFKFLVENLPLPMSRNIQYELAKVIEDHLNNKK